MRRLGAAKGQDLSVAECAFLDPVRRAGWLLARDAHTWVDTGQGAAGLRDAERLQGFATLPSGYLPEPTPQQRAFLADSFAAALARHAAEPLVRAACGQTLSALGDSRFDPHTWHLPADPTLGFRKVPAIPFRMGTDPKREPKGWSDEEPSTTSTCRPSISPAGRSPSPSSPPSSPPVTTGHRLTDADADADACTGHPNQPVCSIRYLLRLPLS